MKLRGGLGNQLFQYSCGRSLSELNNTSLKLDITWYVSHTKRHYCLDRFNISATIASDSEIANLIYRSNNLFRRINSKLQLLKPYYKRNHVFERSLSFDPLIFHVSKDAYLSGFWGSPKYFTNVTELLRKELTLVERIDSINLEYIQRINNCESVSIHIRRGDYVTAAYQKMFGLLPFDYYQRSIDYINRYIYNPHFYIFSDDINWCRSNLKLQVKHEFVTHNDANKAHIDLLLISTCKHHIIANSTFSWWGAWLSDVSNKKIIIAPKNWYADSRYSTDDLIPGDWIKL